MAKKHKMQASFPPLKQEKTHWVEHNQNGMETLTISTSIDLDSIDIPTKFSELITDDIIEFANSPEDYLAKLSQAAQLKGMRSWLERISGSRFWIRISIIEQWGQTYTSFKSDGMHGVFFSETEGFDESHLPCPVLLNTFGQIGGDYFGLECEAGGLCTPSIVKYEEYDPKFACSEKINFSNSWTFYNTGSGDTLFAHEDLAFWFLHETKTIYRAGDLTELLDHYFDALIGTRRSLSFES